MSDLPLYRIKNWSEHFETAESRKLKRTTWVSVKNKHDGKGYRRLVQNPQRTEIFCAWMLILQVASKMPDRGVLIDEDGPLTTDDLAVMTGFPEALFALAIPALIDRKIGWMEIVDASYRENLPASAGAPGSSPDVPWKDPSTGKGGEGRVGHNPTGPKKGKTEVSFSSDSSPTPSSSSPPPIQFNAADRRAKLLEIIRVYGGTTMLGKQDVFHEWVAHTAAFPLGWIEHVFETEEVKPHTPNDLRKILKVRQSEVMKWKEKA